MTHYSTLGQFCQVYNYPVMVHTLKIEYRHAYEPKAFYVAMDTVDIRALREVLERAEAKSASIEIMLQASNIPYLGVEE